jgi:hypothetical protein
MTDSSEKVAYATPALVELGTFEQMTQMLGNGEHTDAAFPSNTPKGKLTFS